MMTRRDAAAIAFAFAGIVVVGDALRSSIWSSLFGHGPSGGMWALVVALSPLGFGIAIVVGSVALANWLFPGDQAAAGVNPETAEAWFAMGLGLLGIYLVAMNLPSLLTLPWVQVPTPGSSVPSPTPTVDAFQFSMRQAILRAAAGVVLGAAILVTRHSLARALAQPRWQLSGQAAAGVWIVAGMVLAWLLFAGR